MVRCDNCILSAPNCIYCEDLRVRCYWARREEARAPGKCILCLGPRARAGPYPLKVPSGRMYLTRTAFCVPCLRRRLRN